MPPQGQKLLWNKSNLLSRNSDNAVCKFMQWREVTAGTRKNMFRVSKKESCFLEDQPWNGRKGYQKICWMGSFTIKKAKRTDQGAISNSNRNPDDHDRRCNVWFNSAFALRHSKKKNEWDGGSESELFAQKHNWRARAKHADKGLSPVSGKADHVFLSFVLGYFINIFLPIRLFFRCCSLKHQLGKNSRPHQQLHCSKMYFLI